jgi:sialate O-acetylesterase
MPPRAPWDANAGIGVMHNRMVAPIGRFALAGAAWYPGESAVGTPGYIDRQRELFAGWRRQFGADMRVLVVQLPNNGPPARVPVESGWAEPREDQRQAALADPNAALVTAIDIGDRTDIHPTNKVVLGQRLALAAQGIGLPMPRSARILGGQAVIEFDHVDGGLETWSGRALAFELCGASQESCRLVAGVSAGDKISLPFSGTAPTRVRYAWADSPVVNTYDGRDLPLPGFELPIEP